MFTEHHTGEVNTVNYTLHANNNPFEKAFRFAHTVFKLFNFANLPLLSIHTG